MKMLGWVLALMMGLAHLPVQASSTIQMCTGGKSGVYFAVGKKMSKAADRDFVRIEPVITKGSWQNMKLVAAGDQCQAAIVQADAYTLFARQKAADAASLDRIGALHKEYTHVLCNKESGIDNMTDLEGKKYTLAIGKAGSGAWVTMENWKAEDEGYKNTPTVPVGGIAAAAKVADGSDVQCMLYNAGLGAGFVHKIDSRFGDRISIVNATDKDFNDAEDPKGRPLYEYADIPSKTYPANLQNGMWSSVETIRQDAVLIVNMDFFEDNEDAYEGVLEAYSLTLPSLKNKR